MVAHQEIQQIGFAPHPQSLTTMGKYNVQGFFISTLM
jgi:hypothetical protein